MSSWVLFKFKSQKDPIRITFDGTGITVFELKRDIINVSQLGDGMDFDLSIYDEGSNDEYDDDTAIVPRSSMIIARRLPAARPGHGKAARYVSGRMPVNSRRVEVKPSARGDQSANVLAAMNNAKTEQEKIEAMFAAEGNTWKEQQQQMAHVKPVFFKGKQQQPRPAFADKPLPQGYVCHRCQQKGHWIFDCPTNDDPTFVPKPKMKKTTGIPRSFLERVDKSEILEEDEDGKPKGYMVDADGNRVRVKADTATWEKEQARQKATAAKKIAAEEQDKELQERGLECSIDHRMFEAPTKTQCCSKTYCHGCIEDALVNNDLVCPNCGTEDVLIDDLLPDTETALKIKAYREEKAIEAKTKELAIQKEEEDAAHAAEKVRKAAEEAANPVESVEAPTTPIKTENSPMPADEDIEVKSASKEPLAAPRSRTNSASSTSKNGDARASSAGSTSKKRAAEEELQNERVPDAPAILRKQTEDAQKAQETQFIADMEKLSKGGFTPVASQNVVMPNPMLMDPMNPMAMGMMNPMTMMGVPGLMPPMMGMPAMMPGMNMNMGFPTGQFNPQFNGNNMNHMNGAGFNQQQQFKVNNQNNWNNNRQNISVPNAPRGPAAYQNNRGNFHNQNQQPQQAPAFRPNQFNKSHPHEEDNAYFRQPVNPNRHQKQRRMRPSEYTELQ